MQALVEQADDCTHIILKITPSWVLTFKLLIPKIFGFSFFCCHLWNILKIKCIINQPDFKRADLHFIKSFSLTWRCGQLQVSENSNYIIWRLKGWYYSEIRKYALCKRQKRNIKSFCTYTCIQVLYQINDRTKIVTTRQDVFWYKLRRLRIGNVREWCFI